jgi:hypothetical protein
MAELCKRKLEVSYLLPSGPLDNGSRVLIDACHRMNELGGYGYFQCPDCQVVFRRQAQDERPLPPPIESE